MKLAECKLCGADLEQYEYDGQVIRKDNVPENIDICYDCLEELKKELSKL